MKDRKKKNIMTDRKKRNIMRDREKKNIMRDREREVKNKNNWGNEKEKKWKEEGSKK